MTSDHGELLGEHGVAGHGSWVYEPLTHVPLIVDRPLDLPPTLSGAAVPDLITDALGVDYDWPTSSGDGLLVSQREGSLAMSPDGRMKGIWKEGHQVYDLRSDPEETAPVKGASLQDLRSEWEGRVPPAVGSMETVQLHPDTLEELRALGYVDQPAATP